MIYPQSFLIQPSNQTGDVYATEFTFKSNFPPQYTRFAWNLGDQSKIVYNQSKVLHTYNYPGFYTVGLSAWTDYGDFATDAANINVDYPYRDSLTFTQIPSTLGVPGTISDTPFTVSLTSSKINQPLSLVLHSYNSKSVPHYAAPDKWKFIVPKWRFKDLNENVLNESVTLSTTPVYKNGKIVAVKADFSFYYVDDVATGVSLEPICPILIIASLSTENFTYPPESIVYPYKSYSNNETVQAVTVCQLPYCIPTSMRVTENFIDNIYPIKWKDVSIPVMLSVRCDSSKLSSYALAEDAPQYDVDSFSYPRSNKLGKITPVTLTLSSAGVELLSGVHYKTDDQSLYFQNTDLYGNISTGYLFTSITPLTSIKTDVVIKANTIANNAERPIDRKYGFDFPLGFPLYYSAYISNSLRNFFYKITYAVDTGDCPFVKFYKALDIFASGTATTVSTPSASEFGESLVNYTLPLTGHGNVYAMSFSPIKNKLYIADIDFNTLSCYSQGTTLLTSVNLQQMFNKSSLGPASISIDGLSNVWVSLLDDRKILKFDYKLNYLLSAAPYPEINEPLRAGSWLEPKNPTFSPPVIETDKENCVWVCYPSYEMPSRLYKFSPTGVTLLSANLPENAVPISLSIGYDNSVWVACKNTNEILAFKSDGTLLSSDGVFSTRLTDKIIRPSYICHDSKGNLCILHGYNLYSYYDMYSNQMKTWEVDFSTNSVKLILPFETVGSKNFNLDKTEIWGGISCDVYDRLWILDSETNQMATSTPSQLSGMDVVPLNPLEDQYTTYIIKGGETTFVSLSVNQLQAINIGVQRSIQAGGDWTGNRWYQKYAGALFSNPIEGTSAPFKIYDLDDSFNIAKVNETWSYADYFKSLAFPEVLQSNQELFKFIGAAAGDGNGLSKDLGGTSYEKIANFVINHSDVDTASTDSLQSIAQQVGADIKNYAGDYPVLVKRLIDLFSVNKKHLFGIPNYETDPFKKTGTLLNSTFSDVTNITADRFYFLKHKVTNSTQIFYANRLGDLEVYSIDLLNVSGLISPISKNYYIFTYNENMINETTPWIDNLIDWANPATTLTHPTSTGEDWFKDEGVVEIMFNNLLTKQLFGK